jgi:hypothetical protein
LRSIPCLDLSPVHRMVATSARPNLLCCHYAAEIRSLPTATRRWPTPAWTLRFGLGSFCCCAHETRHPLGPYALVSDPFVVAHTKHDTRLDPTLWSTVWSLSWSVRVLQVDLTHQGLDQTASQPSHGSFCCCALMPFACSPTNARHSSTATQGLQVKALAVILDRSRPIV